ncbi:MAG: 4Fe-4S binding protein, partial [Clostridiales bacterium]
VGWLAGENPPQAELIKNIPHKLAFDDCWACGNCVKKCGQKALTMGDDFVIWHPERCIYCGYCIPACPYFFISIV